MHIRANTNDARIAEAIIERNEYRLPDAFHPEDVIIDIGAHIGSFSLACLKRGARWVFSYEANEDNFRVLNRNLALYADRRSLISHLAVWKADTKPGENLSLSIDPENTGGHSVSYTRGGGGHKDIPAISIHEVIRQARAKSPNGRIRLLKIDAEGAEYPILYSLSEEDYSYIDEIVGEVHDTEVHGRELNEETRVGEIDDYTHIGLFHHLDSLGFHLEVWNEYSDGLKTFRATRSPIKKKKKGATRTNEHRTNPGLEPPGVPGSDLAAPTQSRPFTGLLCDLRD